MARNSKTLKPPTVAAILEHLRFPLRFRLFETSMAPQKKEVSALFQSLKGTVDFLPGAVVHASWELDPTLHYSLAVFSYAHRPAFLAPTAPVRIQRSMTERRHGFLLLVGDGSYLSACSAGLSWRSEFLEDVLTPLTHRKTRQIVGHIAEAWEKLAFSNLLISSAVVRNQTLEADDLNGVMSPAEAGHQAPRVARVRPGKGPRWTVTLSSGYISIASARQPLEGFLQAMGEIFAIAKAAFASSSSSFLDSFAVPLGFGELPSGVVPTGVLVDLADLREGIAAGELQLDRAIGGGQRERLDDALALSFLDQFSVALRVDPKASRGCPIRHDSPALDGVLELRQNKTSYSVAGALVRGIRVRPSVGDSQSLLEWLRETDALRVTYSQPQYAYLLNQLFEDNSLRAQLPSLRAVLHPDSAIAALTSEKSEPRSRARVFGKKSMFRDIEDRLASSADFLFCDDLGNEWADFVSVESAERAITFWHAKYDAKQSDLSASGLHEVVSQCLKNLGHMRSTREHVAATKRSKWWTDTWGNTNIARTRVSAHKSWDDALDVYVGVMADLAYAPRAAIVVNCLSSAAVSKEIDLIEAGTVGACQFQTFQLVWILSALVHTCRAQGIEPIVHCRP